MPDLLLELRSEEIPARMQAKAREDLARLLAAELAKAGIAAAETVTYATPRRLALIARGLPQATEAVREETKGPKTAAPPQALEGFLRKTGLTREQLEERDGVFFAVVEKPGRATLDVLAEAIPAVIRAFPWPKSMRWGEASISTESPRWVRPLQGIVAMLGEEVVPCAVAGITAGAATVGHRFHHPGMITLGGAHDYVEKLRACHVVVDQDERMAIIATGATMLTAGAGLTLIRDEGLLAENAGLTEWPVPLLGRFDPAFLDVPPEVIQLTARVNQKYFVCLDGSGPDAKLANAFVCVANIDAEDGGERIVAGNAKVLAARLSDARFFYEQDLKVPLEEQAKKLEKIVFHEKLGTVADKVERVAKLARWLVEQGIIGAGETDIALSPPGRGLGEGQPSSAPPASAPHPGRLPGGEREQLAALAERAARLAKADLVTGMVGEFPELQGVMGGYYAAAQGEDPQVAAAIRDHYKPVGQGDDVPTASVTVAVSLADKLDTFVSYFRLSEFPTGSRDPYALRRSVIAIVNLMVVNNVRLRLASAIDKIVELQRPRAYRAAVSGNAVLQSIYDPALIESLKIERPGFGPDRDTFVIINKGDQFGPFRGDPFDDLWDKLAIWHAATDLDQRIFDFAADRLKVQQREAGVRHDLIDAVFALGGEDDLVRLLARVRALQAFVTTEDGANLLAGYKRAANILKKEGWGTAAGDTNRHGDEQASQVRDRQAPPPRDGQPGALAGSQPDGIPQTGEEDPLVEVHDPAFRASVAAFAASERDYEPEPAEDQLMMALNAATPRAQAAVEREDFEGAMAALASLRAPIDTFFDTVTVNDPDPAKRASRLALLARVREAVHQVADFSRIEG